MLNDDLLDTATYKSRRTFGNKTVGAPEMLQTVKVLLKHYNKRLKKEVKKYIMRIMSKT